MHSSTALVTTRKRDKLAAPNKPKGWRPGTPHTSETRRAWLRAYERTGVVSAACEQVGITSFTFYRWMKSKTRINLIFQKKVEVVKTIVEERRLDLLESAHTRLVMNSEAVGHAGAIQFGLTTKGRKRGWSDKPEQTQESAYGSAGTPLTVEALKGTIAKRAADKGVAFADELNAFMANFGERLPEHLREGLRKEIQ